MNKNKINRNNYSYPLPFVVHHHALCRTTTQKLLYRTVAIMIMTTSTLPQVKSCGKIPIMIMTTFSQVKSGGKVVIIIIATFPKLNGLMDRLCTEFYIRGTKIMTIFPRFKSRGRVAIMIMTTFPEVKNCGKIVIIIMATLPRLKSC